MMVVARAGVPSAPGFANDARTGQALQGIHLHYVPCHDLLWYLPPRIVTGEFG